MDPDLDALMKEYSESTEALSKAFIKQSLAWNRLAEGLRGLRERLPNLFTGEIDMNEIALPLFQPPEETPHDGS